MAHLVILASMPAERLGEIRSPHDIARQASRISQCSRVVISVCPEAASALEGGELLETPMWHPIRGPAVHRPDAVPTALATLESSIVRLRTLANDEAAWACAELSGPVELFRHAANRGEAVISLLDLTRLRPREHDPRAVDSNRPRHPNLTFLLACALWVACLLLSTTVKADAALDWAVVPCFLGMMGLVLVPPLRRKVPWPDRIASALRRLFLWMLFIAMTGYVFRVGKE